MSVKFLVDSSVWIDFFNNQPNAQTKKLALGIDLEVILIGDLILAEILQGIKSDVTYRLIKSQLLDFEQRTLCGESIACKSAANFRNLRTVSYTL